MHRFFLPPVQCAGPSLELVDREAHHALKVLRVRRGETVEVLDGEGKILRCTVRDAGRDRVGLEVFQSTVAPAPPFRITLVQALPKGKLFEDIIQKSTELGAFRIVPLITERVVSRFGHDEAESKTTRWRQVALEAIKQCGSPWLPRVEKPIEFEAFLARREAFDLAMFGCLRPAAQHPRSCFEAFVLEQKRLPGSLAFWIGPEGDFSPGEAALLEQSGMQPITLGPLVLRTETAALYCLGIANYELSAPGPVR